METKQEQIISKIEGLTIRDFYASEAMKGFIEIGGKYRRMKLIDRLKWWITGNSYKANFDYDFNNISLRAFELADQMIKERAKQ